MHQTDRISDSRFKVKNFPRIAGSFVKYCGKVYFNAELLSVLKALFNSS